MALPLHASLDFEYCFVHNNYASQTGHRRVDTACESVLFEPPPQKETAIKAQQQAQRVSIVVCI